MKLNKTVYTNIAFSLSLLNYFLRTSFHNYTTCITHRSLPIFFSFHFKPAKSMYFSAFLTSVLLLVCLPTSQYATFFITAPNNLQQLL